MLKVPAVEGLTQKIHQLLKYSAMNEDKKIPRSIIKKKKGRKYPYTFISISISLNTSLSTFSKKQTTTYLSLSRSHRLRNTHTKKNRETRRDESNYSNLNAHLTYLVNRATTCAPSTFPSSTRSHPFLPFFRAPPETWHCTN